jgi:hypothetical protein
MGTSVDLLDRAYGHLVRDSEESVRSRLEARKTEMGVARASEQPGKLRD